MGLNRHSMLWLQEHHKKRVIRVEPVSSHDISPDIYTNNVPETILRSHRRDNGLHEICIGEVDNIMLQVRIETLPKFSNSRKQLTWRQYDTTM